MNIKGNPNRMNRKSNSFSKITLGLLSPEEILNRSRKKVAAAEQTLRSAKQSAEYLKDKYKNINSA